MKQSADLIINFKKAQYSEKFAKAMEPENKEVSKYIKIEQFHRDSNLKIKVSSTDLGSFIYAVDDILEKISLIWDIMKNIQNEKD